MLLNVLNLWCRKNITKKHYNKYSQAMSENPPPPQEVSGPPLSAPVYPPQWQGGQAQAAPQASSQPQSQQGGSWMMDVLTNIQATRQASVLSLSMPTFVQMKEQETLKFLLCLAYLAYSLGLTLGSTDTINQKQLVDYRTNRQCR